MKQAFFVIVLFISFLTVSANSKITLRHNNGDWNTGSAWDLNRVPQSGDTVIIPSNMIATINSNVNTPAAHLIVKVYGMLRFVGGGAKLVVGENSVIEVNKDAAITSTNSPSQVISIGGVTKYEGNGGTIVGPMVADKNSGAGFVAFGNITLPVQFIGFTAARQGSNVLVQWATSQEVNASVFEVERSQDGNVWNKIATIKATGGENILTNYSYTDYAVSSKAVYYRIRQVDNDNKFTYTSVKSVRMDEATVGVKAIAKQGNIVLQFAGQTRSQVVVRMISLNGQVVSSTTLNQPIGQVVIPTQLTGNYIISVSNANDINLNKQVIL